MGNREIEESAYAAAVRAGSYDLILDLFRHEPLDREQAKKLCRKYKKIPKYIKTWVLKHSRKISTEQEPKASPKTDVNKLAKQNRKLYEPKRHSNNKKANPLHGKRIKAVSVQGSGINSDSKFSVVTATIRKICNEYLSELKHSLHSLAPAKEADNISNNKPEAKKFNDSMKRRASMPTLHEQPKKSKEQHLPRSNSLAISHGPNNQPAIIQNAHTACKQTSEYRKKPSELKNDKKEDNRRVHNAKVRPMTAKAKTNRMVTKGEQECRKAWGDVVVLNTECEQMSARLANREGKHGASNQELRSVKTLRKEDNKYSTISRGSKQITKETHLKKKVKHLKNKTNARYEDELIVHASKLYCDRMNPRKPYDDCGRPSSAKQQVIDQERLLALEQNLNYYKSHLPINAMFMPRMKSMIDIKQRSFKAKRLKQYTPKTLKILVNGRPKKITLNVQCTPQRKVRPLPIYKFKSSCPYPVQASTLAAVGASKSQPQRVVSLKSARPMTAQSPKRSFPGLGDRRSSKDWLLVQFISEYMTSGFFGTTGKKAERCEERIYNL